jgi:hypothetical protein
MVDTKLASLQLAQLTVAAQLTNWMSSSISGILQGQIEGVGHFKQVN